mgnify:CR=1 FL=1
MKRKISWNEECTTEKDSLIKCFHLPLTHAKKLLDYESMLEWLNILTVHKYLKIETTKQKGIKQWWFWERKLIHVNSSQQVTVCKEISDMYPNNLCITRLIHKQMNTDNTQNVCYKYMTSCMARSPQPFGILLWHQLAPWEACTFFTVV